MAEASQADLENCVDALYRSLAVPGGLTDAVGSLRRLFGATSATYIHLGPQNQFIDFAHQGHDPSMERLFVDRYAELDPTRPYVLNGKPGQWVQDDRLLDPETTTQPEYVNDFARPAGIRWFRGGKVFEDRSGAAFFSVQRPFDAPRFEAASITLLDHVRPHLQRVARLRAELAGSISIMSAATAAMDHLSIAVCLTDKHRKILYANSAAEAVIATSSTLRIQHGRLNSSKPEVTDMLQRSTAAATRHPRCATAFSPNPHSPVAQRVLVRAIPLSAELPLARFGHGDLVLFFFSSGPAVPGLHALQQLFGLTPAEAELIQLLAQGKSAQACAAERGVSLATVRTQLARIFAKTGTSSQAQLMLLVMAAP